MGLFGVRIRNVVSIALSDGPKVLFACSGIAFDSGHFTRFLTSESLVRVFNENYRRQGHGSLNIEVCRNGDVARGILGSYRSDYGIAVVNIVSVTLGVHPVDLYRQVEVLPCSKVVAVARANSGTLMATTGTLTGDSSGSEDGTQLMLSTCKISKAWEGGPLFDCDGNFVGMNLFLVGEGTSFGVTLLSMYVSFSSQKSYLPCITLYISVLICYMLHNFVAIKRLMQFKNRSRPKSILAC
uniref:Uncharacterized protein n=1 Tax=Avena sativa TaxID=4498 RepID=A0ACD6ARR4_AVESA